MSLNSEMANNYIGIFTHSNGSYLIQAKLSELQTDLYIVAKYDGKTRRDNIIEMVVQLIIENDERVSQRLSDKRSRTIVAKNAGWFGKEVIFGYISPEKHTLKRIKIVNLEQSGTIDNIEFSLHSNSNWRSEAWLVFISLSLIIVGLIMLLIDIAKSGHYILLQRIKKMFDIFNR